jgi:DegV family protein with EDD domain
MITQTSNFTGVEIVQNLSKEKLVEFFAKITNDILKYEENIGRGRPDDISHKEIHVIEAVAGAIKDGKPARATEIASALRIAPGTFTSAADVLEKKNYITRVRDANDQRSIRVELTEKGERANALHRAFHEELTGDLLESISDDDAQTLIKAIDIIKGFYTKKETALKGGKVKIYTDSTCDITPEDAARMGITIIPMSTVFENETYRQNVDLTASEFFEKLADSKSPPTTSQLTAYDLEQIYREAAEDGSEVVAIHLSSALSGTYQSAVIASREIPGVYPVDSQSATMGMALLVRIAAELRDSGKSAQAIAKKLTELSERVLVLAYIPTLKYLVRGGRISSAAGIVGSVLNVYPLLSVRDGVVKSIGKTRGKSMAQREIVKIIDEHGIDKRYGVAFGHAVSAADMEALKICLEGRVEQCESTDCEIGAVIGTHTGPGAVGLAFITAF